jgi:hypothetical protein
MIDACLVQPVTALLENIDDRVKIHFGVFAASKRRTAHATVEFVLVPQSPGVLKKMSSVLMVGCAGKPPWTA